MFNTKPPIENLTEFNRYRFTIGTTNAPECCEGVFYGIGVERDCQGVRRLGVKVRERGMKRDVFLPWASVRDVVGV